MQRAMKWVLTLLGSIAFLSGGFLVLHGSLPPASINAWLPAGNLTAARAGAASVLLQDGRLLITGGNGASGALASTDILSASSGFTAGPQMNFARANHVAVLLQDGRVLVAGGTGAGGTVTDRAEIFDPAANTWTGTGPLMVPRSGATATLLQDGRVLIAGGVNSATPTNSVEIYDPAAGTFSTAAGVLSSARENHAAALLPDGRVIILGGWDGTTLAPVAPATTGNANVLASTDIFDPSNGTVASGPPMTVARMNFTATTALDGSVVAIGGTNGVNDLASIDVLAAGAGGFALSSAQLTTARQGHQAFLLPHNGNILVVGGTSSGVSVSSAELYTPWLGATSVTGAMASARSGATGSPLFQLVLGAPVGIDGALLVAGGVDASSPPNTLARAEVYGFATIKTDQTDYPPGVPVTITGSGWQPGEVVQMSLVEIPDLDADSPIPLTATAGANGNITNTSFSTNIEDANIHFTLTAVGSVSQAQITFTDAGPKPTSVVTFPVGGASYNSSGWSGTLSGTASFATGTTSRVVGVSIKRGSTGLYWNGSSFTNASEQFLAATGTTSWTFAFPFANFPSDGSYTVHSQAVDSNGTEASGGGTPVTFTIDTSAPAAPSAPTLAPSSDSGSSQSDAITNVTTNLKFNGTAEGNSTINLYVDADVTSDGTGATNNAGNWNNITVAGPLGEGTHTIKASATDVAGNTSLLSNSLSFVIDTTPPTMGLSPASGNVNIPFSFSWNITDPTSNGVSSGVDTTTCSISVTGTSTFSSTACSGSHSLAAGTYTVNASAKDIAGNTGSDSRNYTVVSDGTPPVITINPGTPDGMNNWFIHSPVSVTVTADDSTTGNSNVTAFSCTVDLNPVTITGLVLGSPTVSGTFNVSGEGTHAISCTSTDSAGNSNASPTTATVRIDTVKPTLTLAFTPNAPDGSNGWWKTPGGVGYTWTCSDVTSGIDSSYNGGCPNPLTGTVTAQGTTNFTLQVRDEAGNLSATVNRDLKLDNVAPVISLNSAADVCSVPGLNGWCRGTQTAGFTATDATSGLANPLQASFTQSTGTNGSAVNIASGTVADNAGNVAASIDAGPYKIDSVAPTITLTTPPDGASYVLNQVVDAVYTCSDATSGITAANCVGTVANGAAINTASVGGGKLFTVNATDNAGNTANVTHTYSVAYNACVLYDPTRAVKSGATYPIKLYACDATGADVSSSSIVLHATGVSVYLSGVAGALDDAGNANPDFDFRYDVTLGPSGGYIFNLKTSGYSTGTYLLHFMISGEAPGTDHSVGFGVK